MGGSVSELHKGDAKKRPPTGPNQRPISLLLDIMCLLGRYEDHPRFDFSRVQQEPDVHFAHKSGFMCKTTATDPDRLRALIAGGQVDVT